MRYVGKIYPNVVGKNHVKLSSEFLQAVFDGFGAVNSCWNGGFHAVPVLKRVRDISDVDDADSSVKRTDNMIVVT